MTWSWTIGRFFKIPVRLHISMLLLPLLTYNWLQGRWSMKMWLWLPGAFVLTYGFMYLYFHILTPTLHQSWPLPLEGSRTEPMWRLFWGCNFVGIWDELAFINFVFVLLSRYFSFREANLAQAVFFTSFLHEMAFVGWGPVVIYLFALIQGFTFRRSGSLLYIIVLHLMVDTILFYMIANRWYPGWGWHPWL